jgi:aminoglycoside phosphotransferase (APT) family kinase protein
MSDVGWLTDRGDEAIGRAIVTAAPWLAGEDLDVRRRPVTEDQRYWQGSGVIGGVVVKFAWAEAPARRIVHEARVLSVLAGHDLSLAVPEVLLASSRPALLGTRLVPGEPLSPVDVNGLGAPRRGAVAGQLGCFLARLHAPEVLATLRAEGIALEVPEPQATTDTLRSRLPPFLSAASTRRLSDWCDWVDDVLAAPPEAWSALHGDLHGFNLVWDRPAGALVLVADFESTGCGDPAFDFRYLPDQAATTDYVEEVALAYERAGGRPLDRRRVMAWHVRSAMGDALWRTEAGIPLPGGGTAESWVGDLSRRMAAMGCPG